MPQTNRVAKRTTAAKKTYAPRRTYVSGKGAYKKKTTKAKASAPAREPTTGEKIGSFIGGMAQKPLRRLLDLETIQLTKTVYWKKQMDPLW